MSPFNRLLPGVFAVLMVAHAGWAQPREQPSGAVSTAQSPPAAGEPFLALDLAAGVLPIIPGREEQPTRAWGLKGWAIDGSVRFRPWVGLVGLVARTTDYERPATHILGGVRASTPYTFGGDWLASRLFAHALVGYASPETGHAPQTASGGAELVLGGGLDVFAFLRLQIDYVGTRVDGIDAYRVFVGGVVPLCFRGCRDDDGVVVGGPTGPP